MVVPTWDILSGICKFCSNLAEKQMSWHAMLQTERELNRCIGCPQKKFTLAFLSFGHHVHLYIFYTLIQLWSQFVTILWSLRPQRIQRGPYLGEKLAIGTGTDNWYDLVVDDNCKRSCCRPPRLLPWLLFILRRSNSVGNNGGVCWAVLKYNQYKYRESWAEASALGPESLTDDGG